MSFKEEKLEATAYAGSIVEDASESYNGEFEDCDRSQAGSSLWAYVNVVCVIAGTGTLGLPAALGQGGWFGLFILGLAWLMSTYTANILIKCLYLGKGNKRLSTYKDVATEAFGAIGGWVSFFFSAWITLGAPILYMVLSGANLHELCLGTVAELDKLRWTIISTAVVAVPFVFVKNMKEVGIMSFFGAIATAIVVIIVLVQACIDESRQTPEEKAQIVHNPVVWDMFPIALATISFSFGGNIVYPHVEASMKRPNHWPKVAAGALATCAALYFMTAIPGYYIYGKGVMSPVYESISPGVPRTIAIILMTIHVLTATPILVTSFSLDVEEMANVTVERFGRFGEFAIRAIFRLVIMVFVCVIACTVPRFGDLMSLIGAFANCILIFVLPVCFYYKLTGWRTKAWYEHIWCFFICLLGIVALIFGTKSAIENLIAAFS
ncbi:transmembrane amino acid transporter protein-domain-containing protein [Gongronella butleri]|nr:transmembrane amino acid transporter protein-domain-containing protein [Gongronella butleri]